MELTIKQQQALTLCVERYRAGEKYTCIAGFAGSGKSTVIKFIIDALQVDPEADVCYVAFTGKAATVLKQKGCHNAKTAHKLLYYAERLPDGKFIFKARKSLEAPYKIIVVDEVSMLPLPMWELLLSHNVYVIAAGDPGQLPPVNPNDNNHVLDKPHVFLDEIMRQAQDSEIIRLSMWVREGKPINTFPCQNRQVQIFKPQDLSMGMLQWADQVLVATNQKRNDINKLMREARGFGETPEVGDKIIGLSNHWDCYSWSGEWNLTNGCIGTIGEFCNENIWLPRYISTEPINYMITTMDLDDGDYFMDLPIDYNCLLTGEPSLTPKQQYQLKKNKKIELKAPYEFAYAYAITTWKAQGSEWDNVLGIEERFPFDRLTHQQFIYTLCTRASKRLVFITKD